MRHEADTVGDTEADGEELEEGGQGAGGTGQGYYWLVAGPAVKTDNGQRTTDHLHDVPAQDLNAELLRRSLVRGYEAIRRLEASLLGLKRKQLRREMAWNDHLNRKVNRA